MKIYTVISGIWSSSKNRGELNIIFTKNKYGGVVIDAENLSVSSDEFAQRLSVSLQIWISEGLKLVWLTIPAEKSALLPIAVDCGFSFHHCSPKTITLIKPLESETPVPFFASHTVGVGAVVIRENRELLTVLEKGETRSGYYKLPGGMLEPGEFITEAAVREVYEETAVETRFESFIGFRHHHRGQFGTSNLYAVCRLAPLSRKIKIDKSEIADARWMSVDDFLNDEEIGLFNKEVVKAALSANLFEEVKIEGYMNSATDYEIFLPEKRVTADNEFLR